MRFHHGEVNVILELYEAKRTLLRLLLEKAAGLIFIIVELHVECVQAIVNLCYQ